MAVLPQQKEEESTMDVTGATPTLGAPSAIGQTPAATAPQQTPSSGLFTGINKYLEANKGAGEKVGGAIQQKAQTSAQQTGQAIQEKLGQYKTGAQQAQQNIQGAQQFGSGLISGIQQGQTNLSPEQVKQFQAAQQGLDLSGRALSTTAPLDITAQQKAQQELQNQARQAQTATGTFDLLNQFFRTPQRQYTPGQQLLDTTFLRRTPGAVQQTQQALGQAAAETQKNVAGAQQEFQASEQALGESVKNIQQQLKEQREAAQTGLQSQLQKQAEQAIAQREATKQQIERATQANNLWELSPELRKQLGLPEVTRWSEGENIYDKIMSDKYVSPEEYKSFQDWATNQALFSGGVEGFRDTTGAGMPQYKLDLSSYFPGMTDQYSPEQIGALSTSPEQLAQARAYAQLIGQQQTIIPQEELVGQGLGGEIAGISFDEAAAQQRQQQLMEQYFKEQPFDPAMYHPTEQQRLDAYIGARGGQITPEQAAQMQQLISTSPVGGTSSVGQTLQRQQLINDEEAFQIDTMIGQGYTPEPVLNQLVQSGRLTQDQSNQMLNLYNARRQAEQQQIQVNDFRTQLAGANDEAKRNMMRREVIQNLYNQLTGGSRMRPEDLFQNQ